MLLIVSPAYLRTRAMCSFFFVQGFKVHVLWCNKEIMWYSNVPSMSCSGIHEHRIMTSEGAHLEIVTSFPCYTLYAILSWKNERLMSWTKWFIGMGWDSWLSNLAWSLPFMGRVPFSGHNLRTQGWGDMMMKGQPNWDSNPVPPSQGSNHASDWANKAGFHFGLKS